jgi:uncharacterized protein (UPF0276 family)
MAYAAFGMGRPPAYAMSVGLGLKPEHYQEALESTAPGLWFEVHAENYFVDGGPRLAWLQAIGQRHPVAVHGVALSLAGPDPLDREHLRQLARLVERVEPVLVSEHLAWSRWQGNYLPDLLPVLRTGAVLERLASKIGQVQDLLRRPIAIENPAHYLRAPLEGWTHDWDEVDFLSELVARCGCSLLLDLNNLHVSAKNLAFDATLWLDRFPIEHVSEIHLAGHAADPQLGEGLLIDTHDASVAAPVWQLWRHLLGRAGPRPTLIERDGHVPSFAQLLEERALAMQILARTPAQASLA